MAATVHRVTMFKLPKEEDQKAMVEEYKKLWAAAKKDGKPYVISLVSGPAEPNERSQGYTFVAKSEFATFEDMKYYDVECAAHQDLKTAATGLEMAGPPLTVFFQPQVLQGKGS